MAGRKGLHEDHVCVERPPPQDRLMKGTQDGHGRKTNG
jgi:hypothetical protein